MHSWSMNGIKPPIQYVTNTKHQIQYSQIFILLQASLRQEKKKNVNIGIAFGGQYEEVSRYA